MFDLEVKPHIDNHMFPCQSSDWTSISEYVWPGITLWFNGLYDIERLWRRLGMKSWNSISGDLWRFWPHALTAPWTIWSSASFSNLNLEVKSHIDNHIVSINVWCQSWLNWTSILSEYVWSGITLWSQWAKWRSTWYWHISKKIGHEIMKLYLALLATCLWQHHGPTQPRLLNATPVTKKKS